MLYSVAWLDPSDDRMLTFVLWRWRIQQEWLKAVLLPIPTASMQDRLAFVRHLHAISFSRLWNGIVRLYLPTLVVLDDYLYPGIVHEQTAPRHRLNVHPRTPCAARPS